MSRRPARFTEADLRRAWKVAKERDGVVKVLRDGSILIIPVEHLSPADPGLGPKEDIVL